MQVAASCVTHSTVIPIGFAWGQNIGHGAILAAVHQCNGSGTGAQPGGSPGIVPPAPDRGSLQVGAISMNKAMKLSRLAAATHPVTHAGALTTENAAGTRLVSSIRSTCGMGEADR